MGEKALGGQDSAKAISILEKEYPNAKYYLDFGTPIDLLAAAIISAQTRDEVVNSVTPALFKKYKTARDYAKADVDGLVGYIGKVSFAGNKAKNIISACRIIEEKYSGKVPNKAEELIELPGIGRKTANTILINAYGIVEGIPVDTWVIKLSYRIGLSLNKDPDKIEQDLMKVVDRKYWKNFAYVLKAHGKKICQSQVPICSKCPLNKICPRNGVTKSL
ncbi:MAG: endonuclease III [Candidatus Micrarchaeota archaeon]|nr:endonuclease III [Candidatus Micrarchaeota archaeon]MDE1846740.1 endonuclease III [Candidatus Micrarchaeota archaeon]